MTGGGDQRQCCDASKEARGGRRCQKCPLTGSQVPQTGYQVLVKKNIEDCDQDDEQGEGDVFEDRRGKMPRTTSPVSLQSTLWQGLLFQV